jgi:hypothetical protein
MTPTAPGTAPEGDRGRRATIVERAARRAWLEQQGYDSPQGLARWLRGDRADGPSRRGRWSIAVHPVARRLLLAFVAILAAYMAVSFVAAQLREVRVDTWTGPSGPDASVQSGMRLEGCLALRRTDDDVFPNWVRFEGRVYQPAGAQLPIGSTNIGVYYFDSGYTNGELRIYRVEYAPLGEPGERILVVAEGSPAGALFRVIPGCR